MANIRPYEAPSGIGLSPTEVGIDAAQGAARRLSAFGEQMANAKNQEGHEIAGAITDAGAVVDADITHRDISAGAANFAQFMAQKNSEWEDIAKNSDPNDRGVQQKFLQENLEPALQQFQQGFSTEKSQAWAEHSVDAYREHMFEKTTATMSTLAGEAATVNAAKTINGLSSAVAVDPSTHSIDNAIMMLDHSLGSTVDSSPNITAETAARVKTELSLKGREAIVKSAVSSMITNNPNVDLDAIQKKYGDYINGADMKMFQRAAQTQAKSNALMDKQDALLKRQQADLAVHEGAGKVMTDNVSFDPTGKPILDPKFFNQTLDLARKNPNAPAAAATVRTMLDWGESQQNKEIKPVDDPVVKSGLMTRMFSADQPTTTLDLMKARAQGKISDQTFQAYHGLVQELEQSPLKGPVWQDTVAAVKGELVLSNVGLPGKDIPGETNYAKWAQTFIPQYLAKSRAGTLPPNALDVKDPTSMISQSMAPFKRTVAQRAQDYLATLGGVAPAVGGHEVPAPLRGIAALQYNAARNQWRDQTSGTTYDASGREVSDGR
jgi:hypothetical protein